MIQARDNSSYHGPAPALYMQSSCKKLECGAMTTNHDHEAAQALAACCQTAARSVRPVLSTFLAALTESSTTRDDARRIAIVRDGAAAALAALDELVGGAEVRKLAHAVEIARNRVLAAPGANA